MRYTYRFRLDPTPEQRELLDQHRDTCRQLYNHALTEFEKIPESAGTLTHRVRQVRDQLTDLKVWWDELNDLYSTVAQAAVMRIEDSIKALSQLKQNGYNVGSLNWKAPKDFRSFTYIQSGFEFDSKNGQTVLSLSKLADVPLIKHRTIPDTETIKQVTIKKEPTGDWFASFVVDGKETPEKPTDPDRCVGIDVGILKYAHDTDGYAIESPDFSDERERLERAQRDLSRKEHGSTNWETQRQTVAERHADLKRKRRDFLHKLSNYYATEYDLVAVEDLDVKRLVELPRNSRNRVGAAWGTFLRMLEYKCEREGTHFVAVNPRGTTKECASCGVKTEKPLWMREHSCPACGFEADRDANAAWNILSRGLEEVGVGYSESTPVETALPVDTPVSTKRVVETGSPTLKERTASAVSE
ncbi:transposase [Halorubrum ezzemoulense]|uniref:Transposase n=3 Tax=Halorubrum ezzemoulense TaxID=337243 RepID=A0ABT4Z6T8_HALEZ|nr:transposase [Halorubrum ezzemoulense]MDB2246348.1 transposase [Halorubrum ezzemoulense]MDB2253149.1 transposase [Halorubrum ezzemoulense]MDB2279968.1 transposase [Halorubrum ezzemoulense]MDB2286448.1 transposase [Halorubrum ezzemoulense]MDB2293790.1 transposase [Halorubrum ezzemoulense]